jgi:cell division protein ZapA
MSSFKITVNIADREYRLNINRDEEEKIRAVVKHINTNLRKYAENFEFKDKQDLLAMVVLEAAVKNSEMEKQLDFQQNQLAGKLAEVNRVLTEPLST